MKKTTSIAIIVLVLGVIALFVLSRILPVLTEKNLYNTSDMKNYKGNIRIALDSWIGYFVLQSSIFRKTMRDNGYNILIENDNADYGVRSKRLKKSDIDLAVYTVDSYILNTQQYDFPATIIAVIDESRGGDALVAWENNIKNINMLKSSRSYRIAYTPDSPSHHLLKSIAFHFGINRLLSKKGGWSVETDGAGDAFKTFMNKKTDMAVLWEPYVTKALKTDGVTKILGSEDMDNLIIDILVANRDYATENSEAINLLLRTYFDTLSEYRNNMDLMAREMLNLSGADKEDTMSMIKGVDWYNYARNISAMGVGASASDHGTDIFSSIDSTVRILVENSDFKRNPLPNRNPGYIVNSSFLEALYVSGYHPFRENKHVTANSLTRKFPPLKSSQWNKLKIIGTLKIHPITFIGGTDEIDEFGKEQLEIITSTISHYPNFRILIKGHTGLRGDAAANRALSKKRASKAKLHLVQKYKIDKNRILAVGVGGAEPLKMRSGESSRAYQNRLKRVEVYLLTDNNR